MDPNYEPTEEVVLDSVKASVPTPTVTSSKKVATTPVKKTAKIKKKVHYAKKKIASQRYTAFSSDYSKFSNERTLCVE